MRTRNFALASIGLSLLFGGGSIRAEDKREKDYGKEATDEKRILRSSEAVGMKVKTPDGEALGKINEIVLDPDTGRVAYAVLSSGGFFGIGDDLHAIPWIALECSAKREHFVLDVEKEKLKNAPGFDEDDWPNMADRRWGREVHTFYLVTPYWELDSESSTREVTKLLETADIRREKASLDLSLEEGDTFRYRVEVQDERIAPASFREGGGERPQEGRTAPSDTARRDDSTRGSATDDRSRSASTPYASYTPAQGSELILTVTGSSEDGATLHVTFKDGSETDSGPGTTCNVTIDSSGRIEAFQMMEAKRERPDPSQGREASSERSASDDEKMKEMHARHHLACVLGAGLHDRHLEPGMTYAIASETEEPKSNGESDSSRAARETKGSGEKRAMGPQRLRYEGTATLHGQKTALFTVVSEPAAAEREATSRSRPGGDQSPEARDHDQVAYRIDDGLLEVLSVHPPKDRPFVVRRMVQRKAEVEREQRRDNEPPARAREPRP